MKIVIYRADTFARLIGCPQDPVKALERLRELQEKTGIRHFLRTEQEADK